MEQAAFDLIQPRLGRPSVLSARPHITLTYAQTLDGFIGGPNRTQVLISSKESLVMTHTCRALHSAILVGCQTVRSDNPSLTVRMIPSLPPAHPGGPRRPVQHPTAIVVDSSLSIDPGCNLVQRAKERPLIVLANETALIDRSKREALELAGASVVLVPPMPSNPHRIDLAQAFYRLHQEPFRIDSIMVEGGASIISSVLEQQLADLLIVTIAPKFMGRDGVHVLGSRPAASGEPVADDDASASKRTSGVDGQQLARVQWQPFGIDMVMVGEFVR
ncbi:dihydrofolate reductase-like domain-containing protein [Polychytrium aggregatum]|uniref:dihydrofolate reductase-like domain-containing protein n=1 Tax=Polychytrium aggregatum TaxID=110093 RepID=UPI0022FE7465|nr:dihydrofolate reductase-like domain-containing protein [Polychytrium aggregatum]KAI9193221.1 dihydrofolate reductase-like domain-containing protein [Polychytrium aggregatum]